MEPTISPVLFALLLFLGMLLLLEAGRRLGLSRRLQETERGRGSLGTIEGAVFALFGLLIAFTFSGAASRFSEKRQLIAEEVNAVQTAYLRLQLVPQEQRIALQGLLRSYVDSRLEAYRLLPDMQAAAMKMTESKKLQGQIWTRAVAATRLPDAHVDAGKLLLPAVNTMIDVTTSRAMALQAHPPRIIYVLLFSLGLICSLLAGYRMADVQHRNWLHILAFAVITASVVYVILDIEYPRSGLIRLETADQLLVEAREEMN